MVRRIRLVNLFVVGALVGGLLVAAVAPASAGTSEDVEGGGDVATGVELTIAEEDALDAEIAATKTFKGYCTWLAERIFYHHVRDTTTSIKRAYQLEGRYVDRGCFNAFGGWGGSSACEPRRPAVRRRGERAGPANRAPPDRPPPKARQNEERLFAGPRGRDWGLVFASTIGMPLDGGNISKRLQRHLERVGLPKQRFHDLRHCCAALLLAQGVHPRVVMEILGHSQSALTRDTYSHVMSAAQREAAALMDDILAAGG